MSDLTAAEWNERYPAGTPVLHRDGTVLATVGSAWFDPGHEGNSAATATSSGDVVCLDHVEPLFTDDQRRADGWVDYNQAAGLADERDAYAAKLADYQRRCATLGSAEAECKSLQALLDLQQTRMTEAVELWREESPTERASTLPDLGDLLTWLIHRRDEARQTHPIRSDTTAAVVPLVMTNRDRWDMADGWFVADPPADFQFPPDLQPLRDLAALIEEHAAEYPDPWLGEAGNLAALIKGHADTERLHRTLTGGDR